MCIQWVTEKKRRKKCTRVLLILFHENWGIAFVFSPPPLLSPLFGFRIEGGNHSSPGEKRTPFPPFHTMQGKVSWIFLFCNCIFHYSSKPHGFLPLYFLKSDTMSKSYSRVYLFHETFPRKPWDEGDVQPFIIPLFLLHEFRFSPAYPSFPPSTFSLLCGSAREENQRKWENGASPIQLDHTTTVHKRTSKLFFWRGGVHAEGKHFLTVFCSCTSKALKNCDTKKVCTANGKGKLT